MGKMTTRAFSKSVVVGVVPPNSPSATCSYSNGRLIHFLEAIVGDRLPVDGHRARTEREHRLGARGEQRRGRRRERADEERQGDGRVRLDRDPGGIGGELPPALRLLEAGAGCAAKVR